MQNTLHVFAATCALLGACAETPADPRPAAPGAPLASVQGDAPSQREQDAERVVQLVLDAPQLAPYWHVDERPERAPLELEISADLVTFAASHGRALPRLVKFDQPVILRNTPPAPGDRPWEQRFRVRLEMAADVATVELHYPVEGLHGKAKLVKTSGVWRVEQLTVAEQ